MLFSTLNIELLSRRVGRETIFFQFPCPGSNECFFFPEPGLAAVAKGSIEGTVLSAETNRPLAGAAIELRRSYPRKPLVTFHAESDAEGKFSALLPAGTYHYLIRSSGFGIMEGTAVVTAGAKVELPLPLNREARISGRVTDATGKPLAGIAVSFGKYAGGRTDSSGRFTVPSLNEGWYELRLNHPSWVPERQVSFSLSAGERKDAGDVIVRKAGSLVVRLVAGNRPVAGAEVSLSGNLDSRYGKTDKSGMRAAFQSSLPVPIPWSPMMKGLRNRAPVLMCLRGKAVRSGWRQFSVRRRFLLMTRAALSFPEA